MKNNTFNTLKKTIAFLLVVITIFASISISFTSTAASVAYFNVTKNCTIKSGPGEKYKTIGNAKKGSVVTATAKKKNEHGNTWYKIKWDNDRTGYIWSGNIKAHKHSYKQQTYRGITFKTCKNNCTKIVVVKSTSIQLKNAQALAAIAPTAGTIAMADGPVMPVGDIVAVAFTAISYYLITSKKMTKSQAKEMVTEIDFDDYLKSRKNVCNDYSFKQVVRKNGALYYKDKTCLDLMEAYIVVRYLCKDVYTKYKASATQLATMHIAACKSNNEQGGYYYEKDANKPEYYYHYHLKVNGQKLPAHVFYGTTSSGKRPK